MYLLLNNEKKRKIKLVATSPRVAETRSTTRGSGYKVNGKIVPDDSTISNKDTVKIIKVIFGG